MRAPTGKAGTMRLPGVLRNILSATVITSADEKVVVSKVLAIEIE